MEVIEFLPGALAAVAMAVRIAVFFRPGADERGPQEA